MMAGNANKVKMHNISLFQTSTGLYRSYTALASFSGTFDLILFQAVHFEFIVEKVLFCLVWIDGLNKEKINGFWFALIEFGLVCLFHRHTNK